MAKQASGERSLKLGNRTIRLRLDTGSLLDLEDHFEMGILKFITERLPDMRVKDIAALYCAMTGKDFLDKAALTKAAQELIKIGLGEAIPAITECLEATLSPEGAGGKSK